MNRSLLISLVISTLMGVSTAFGRVIYFGSEPEELMLAPEIGTLFRFDQPVKTVSRAGNFAIEPLDHSNPDYSILSVRPRSSSYRENVTFILADGTLIKTLLTVSASELKRRDHVYELKVRPSVSNRQDAAAAPFVGKIDLMKAIIRGDLVSGYKMEERDQSIPTGLSGVSARLVRVYLGQDAHGYVYELRNVSGRHRYQIDVSKLELGRPNLALFSETSREILEPKGGDESKALLHIVAKPASLYRRIFLPVTWMKPDDPS